MHESSLKTILIVDDDPGIRSVIRNQIKSFGFRVAEASNKPEALAFLIAGSINIVVCDIKMKEENGFDILREIHTEYPSIPVIMLTGFIEKEYYDRAKELGAIDLIIKPVRKERLFEVLEKALKK